MATEFDELFNTFDTKGWLLFKEDIEKYKKSLINTAWEECFTNEDIAERRGAIKILSWISTYEDSIKQTDRLKKEDESY